MSKNLKGLKIGVNQMPVIPGRPDLNAKYIIKAIEAAQKDEIDILVFPEMCVPGYMIGDLWEDQSFAFDVASCNLQIERAVPMNMTVIFGSLLFDPSQKGEDGRSLKHNGAFIINNKKRELANKTLQPNYRIFDDDRHFFSNRKIAEVASDVLDLLEPIQIETRIGKLSIGVILCEDMWHQDYPFNPAEILVSKEAEIIFNLSASPWTWQKNRKRHQVVRDLLKTAPVPFVYVNNAGTQNNGKNIIVFDGSSTVYDESGEMLLAVPPYVTGTYGYVFSGSENLTERMAHLPETVEKSLAEKIKLDADELYAGWECAVKGAFDNLPLSSRKAVIGLSGGIDSAVDAALLAKILGPENVYAINMPSRYNSEQTKDIAYKIAQNLGINYEIRPIDSIVQALSQTTETSEDSLSYENIQARVRMEILAAGCQNLNGVFICNSNKIEMAFGYGTLYGDIAGFIAPLGDMLKYEVYQMGDYLNRVVYQCEVIPSECFTIKPSAELRDKQSDPFHYGSLDRRGYHDELVRSFTEFRLNPEWVLERYLKGSLESNLKLEPGTMALIFKTPIDFLIDLEKNYRAFVISFFKRNQAPPVPILSKRSFGFDLRESMLCPHFTGRYYDLKQRILSLDADRPRVALFGGSFNPTCKHHEQIAEKLREEFSSVVIVPCGSNRSDKDSVRAVSDEDRKALAIISFVGIPGVSLDLSDLEKHVYTPTYLLEERYAAKYPNSEIWHVIGSDLVKGGKDGNSEIQRIWARGKELWQNLKFYVISRPGYELDPEDLPPISKLCEIPSIYGSGTLLRSMIDKGEDVSNLVSEEVLAYIKANKLYGA